MPKLTIEEVRRRVGEVAAAAKDENDELAHVREDELWYDVLKAIATRMAGDPVAIAIEALSTKNIGFNRVCS